MYQWSPFVHCPCCSYVWERTKCNLSACETWWKYFLFLLFWGCSVQVREELTMSWLQVNWIVAFKGLSFWISLIYMCCGSFNICWEFALPSHLMQCVVNWDYLLSILTNMLLPMVGLEQELFEVLCDIIWWDPKEHAALLCSQVCMYTCSGHMGSLLSLICMCRAFGLLPIHWLYRSSKTWTHCSLACLMYTIV